MSVTIEDVARFANVGVGTVSRVLNDSPKVSSSTRERVLDAIATLKYRPVSAARNLSRKTRTPSIGVITQPFSSYHSFAERLRGAQLQLSELESNYELVLYSVSSLQNVHERLEQITKSSACDAIVIIDLEISDVEKEGLRRTRTPFVGINHFQDQNWTCIGTSNTEGGYLATKYLIDQGHRRIAYVGDTFLVQRYAFHTSRDRVAGYHHAMVEAKLDVPDSFICVAPYGYEPAREQTHQLLQQAELPTAIFAMSDMQALGVIAAIREKGLRVPEDISVIGYDDLEISMHTGLTTVRQHLELSGKVAIAFLLNQLVPTQYPAPSLELPPLQVIERATVAKR